MLVKKHRRDLSNPEPHLHTRTCAFCFMPNIFPIELSDIFPAVPKQMYSSPLWCYEPFSASAWTFDATSCSILSRVPRTRLDCLTASKINYSKDRIWNPVLCSELTNKLTIDLKSFCLFPLVCMSDSYLKREPDHKSSLHCCVMMKLVYKQVSFPFSFVSFFPYATTCLPVLLSCSCFLFRFYILILSPSALLFVPNTIYIYIHISKNDLWLTRLMWLSRLIWISLGFSGLACAHLAYLA